MSHWAHFTASEPHRPAERQCQDKAQGLTPGLYLRVTD